MKLKVALPLLLLTHGVAGGVGFFVAKSLLAKDPAWLADNQRTEQGLVKLDQAAAAGTTTRGDKPPEGFAPRIAAFAIQSKGMSRVSFTSDAPLEQIVGTTTNVTGTIRVDSAAVAKSSADPIAVAVGTLKTGNDTRDGHLQGEGWFDTAKHPSAVFTLARIEGDGGIWPGRAVDVKLHGSLAIKGVSKDVTVPATVAWYPTSLELAKFVDGDILRIKSTFDVALSDFGISAAVVGQKVAEIVQIDLNLTAVEQK